MMPYFFETSSETIKIKDQNSGIVKRDEHQDLGTFCVDKLSQDDNEVFAIGLTIRSNDIPVPLVCERLIEQEEISSFEQN